MTRGLEVTAQAGPLADAAARLSRLLPTRSALSAHAGLTLRADGDGLLLLATDGEVSARMRVPAVIHEPGELVVSRRGLAETVAALDVPELRLAAEGSRLAVRAPGARFALPRLPDAGPGPAELPEPVGSVAGQALRVAAVPVAGAASREHALPLFTGVRLRSDAGGLALLATDRYRLASASVPWQPPAGGSGGAGGGLAPPAPVVDALVPAAFLAEVARQAARAATVTVHAGGELFGLSWAAGSVVTATLGAVFPDRQVDRLFEFGPECVVEVDADALAAAVDRATRYAGVTGRLTVRASDGVLMVRASDPLAGESEEAIKATVHGDHVTRHYQARLLADALRSFDAATVRLRIQAGTRATEVTGAAAEQAAVDLRYLIVPLQGGDDGDGGSAPRPAGQEEPPRVP